MTCNCKNTDELRIVRGNAFSIRLTVNAVHIDGTPVENFVLGEASPVLKVMHNETATTKEFIIVNNNAVINFGGDLSLGWYGLEMTGIFNEKPWRWCVPQVFQIVETNQKANIPEWVFLTDDTYMMDGVTTITSGDIYQSDWNEASPSSPSYIKNKPNLGIYATTSQLNTTANQLQQNINQEENRAKAAEQSNATAIGNEALARSGADATLQNNIDAEALARRNADTTLQGHIDAEETRAKAAEKQNADDIDALEIRMGTAETDIDTIESKIPAQASAQNQLADKDFVNSSISTSTATFRGTYNEVTDLSLTTEATQEQIAAALGSHIIVADNNDYVFVQIPTSTSTPTQIASVQRYKYNGSIWQFEYELNNSGFTADQWAAVNSGITSGLVAKLGDLPTDAELTQLLNGKADKVLNATSGNLAGLEGNGNLTDSGKKPADFATAAQGVKADNAAPQSTTYTKTEVDTALGGKQNTLTFDNAPTENSNNPVKSGGIYTAIATAVSGLLNTEQVQSLISTALQPYSTTEQMNSAITTALVNYYTKNAIDTLLSNKVDKVSGKQLSTEDFTTALKQKLDGLPDATALAQQIQTAITTALGLYYTKTETDSLLADKQTAAQVSAAIASALTDYSTTSQMNSAISNSITAALADYYTKSQTYSKTEIDSVNTGKIVVNDTATFINRMTAGGKLSTFGKYEFELVDDPTGNPSSLGYYEQTDLLKFQPTADTSVQANKKYFIRSIDNTSIMKIMNIQGNAVAWNQLVQNGDFSDGTNHWEGTEISTSVSGGKMTVTYTQSNGRLRNTINWVVGHKYYVCATATSSTMTLVHLETDFGLASVQTLCYANTTTLCHGLLQASSQGEFNWLQIFTDEANTITIENVMVIDLTLIFGAGNEPTTAAEFESWLANHIGTANYYPYNAGELLPCKLTGIKTVGFNALNINGRTARTDYSDFGYHDDPHPFSESEYLVGFSADDYIIPEIVTIYSVNDNTITTNGGGGYGLGFPIKVLPNTSYYFQKTYTQGYSIPRVGFYDSGGKFISCFISFSQDFLFTTPPNCCWAVIVICPEDGGTVTVQDLCINISNASKNGTYEPYKTFTRNLDVTLLYGKNSQGNYVQMFPNGMRSAGSVHDVVDLENAKADVKVGTRAYLSGDESDSTVITDMTNTFYPLATPIHYTDVVYRDGGADFNLSDLYIKEFYDGTEQEILAAFGSNGEPTSCAATLTIKYKI